MTATHHSRIPPLLDPCVRLPPEASLTLLTGTTTATPHWLTVRFLARLLGASGDEETNVGVVLVSWMRDEAFWTTEARRGAGLDLRRLSNEGRWGFVDGLSNLFLADTELEASSIPCSARLATRPAASIPVRGALPTESHNSARTSPLPVRTALPQAQSTIPRPPGQASPKSPTTLKPSASLNNPALSTASSTITSAIEALSPTVTKNVLILDSPTLLLATGTTSTAALNQAILRLRSLCHTTIIALEADLPFLSAAMDDHCTSLEREHAAFVVGLGHAARVIMGTRGLDTGTARDVSGVLSIRKGGQWDDGEPVDEMEVLYRVGVDGVVRVFERGLGA